MQSVRYVISSIVVGQTKVKLRMKETRDIGSLRTRKDLAAHVQYHSTHKRNKVYCKTQFTSRQHNNNINYNSISINTQLICYMFRLFLSHQQAYTSRTTVFQFCLTVFELLHWGIPFALQIIIIVCMVLGAHCCS